MEGNSNLVKKIRNVGKPYKKWSHDEKIKLIKIRISCDNMFTSKNANINDGWRRVAELLGDPKKDLKACRQLWKNLSQKYKSFFEHNTGDGAGDDAPNTKEDDMESWPYFKLFHEYATSKDNYHPPFLLESSLGPISMASTAIESEPSPTSDLAPSNSSQELAFSPLTRTARLSTSSSTSLPSYSLPSTSASPQSALATKKFSAYEQYCMKRDKKLNKKIGGLMAIFGQMVSMDYPDINVEPLLVCSSSDEE